MLHKPIEPTWTRFYSYNSIDRTFYAAMHIAYGCHFHTFRFVNEWNIYIYIISYINEIIVDDP